jgi:hypothetical protein
VVLNSDDVDSLDSQEVHNGKWESVQNEAPCAEFVGRAALRMLANPP